MQVNIQYWQYMDGWREIPEVLRIKNSTETNSRYFDKDLKGWHCWVYSDDDNAFADWMKANMTGEYDCTWRFNSGNPMMTVTIRNDEDATMFKLTWNPTPDRFGEKIL